MSFRDESEELKKPLLHTGSWYRMGSRQSSIMGSFAQVIHDNSISVVYCGGRRGLMKGQSPPL
jgi:SP family sugar porter-like MFS transporter